MRAVPTPTGWFEALEPRRHLAFSAGDYFPLPGGQTWTYTATANGSSTNVTRTTAAATVSGKSVVRVRDQATVSGKPSILDQFFRHDEAAGLKLFRMDLGASGLLTAIIAHTTPVPILPRTFAAGVVSTWTNLPVNGTFTVPALDNTPHASSGLETGSTKVTALTREKRAGYSFISPINVLTVRSQRYTVSVEGQSYTVTLGIRDSWNLAYGIGMISESTRLDFKVVGGSGIDAINYSTSITGTATLNGCTLLTSFTRLTNGVLRVGGSSGNDVIGAGFDDNEILVVRNNVGIDYPTAGVTGLVIDGAAGNDLIGPIKLGRMRTTLVGGLGNDTVTGGSGRDLIYGGDGNDILVGAPGIDTLYGDTGNDILNGSSGADYVNGGAGSDIARTDDLDTRVAIEVLV